MNVNEADDSLLSKSFSSIEDGCFFLKLSVNHLKDFECSEEEDVRGLNQVRTSTSILVCNEKVYIKVYNTDAVSMMMRSILWVTLIRVTRTFLS